MTLIGLFSRRGGGNSPSGACAPRSWEEHSRGTCPRRRCRSGVGCPYASSGQTATAVAGPATRPGWSARAGRSCVRHCCATVRSNGTAAGALDAGSSTCRPTDPTARPPTELRLKVSTTAWCGVHGEAWPRAPLRGCGDAEHGKREGSALPRTLTSVPEVRRCLAPCLRAPVPVSALRERTAGQ